jgi:hypothetical protein
VVTAKWATYAEFQNQSIPILARIFGSLVRGPVINKSHQKNSSALSSVELAYLEQYIPKLYGCSLTIEAPATKKQQVGSD